MKNLILKQGDLVRYRYPDAELNALGYVLGQVYKVEDVEGALVILRQDSMVSLVDTNGKLLDSAECFNLIQCPIVLPIGTNKTHE